MQLGLRCIILLVFFARFCSDAHNSIVEFQVLPSGICPPTFGLLLPLPVLRT